MALIISTIYNWLKRIKNTFICALHGYHSNPAIIEVYYRHQLIRNYLVVGHKIIFGPPYKCEKIHGKLKCLDCGEIYLGFIVKDGRCHGKHHNA